MVVAVLPEAIRAGGILIRRWRVEDAALLSRAVADSLEHLRPWMPWAAGESMSLEQRRTWVEEREREWQEGGDVLCGVFVGDAVAGGCGLHRRRGPTALEIGYWTHAAFTRRGIATAAAAALTDAAFRVEGIDGVEIHHDRANVASAGVPRRLGFRFLGETPGDPEAPGEEGVRWAWRMDRHAWSVPSGSQRRAARPSSAFGTGDRDGELAAVTVGPLEILDGPVSLCAYDPRWPRRFEREARRIRGALGDAVLRLEHVGSTAVPGLVAKPRIDILLAVADPADEPAYVPALEAAGYVLRVREPDWHQHRLLNARDGEVNVHVFGPRASEIERLLRFRDRLRDNAPDRERYAAAKRELAARRWRHMQDYADAKSGVVEAILRGAAESRGDSSPLTS